MEKQPNYIAPEKLSKQRSEEILKKFKAEGVELDENEEYFIARIIKDGKNYDQYFPKWEKIPYKDGTKVDIEDDIKKFLKSSNV